MDFKSAHKKFLEGTATPEETEFVRNELAKARAVNDIDTAIKDNVVFSEKNSEEVKNVVKKTKKKSVLKTICISVASVASLVVITGAVLGTVFGIAVTSANKTMKYTLDKACDIAVTEVKQKFSLREAKVTKREKDFRMVVDLTKSYYIYDIEVNDLKGTDYDVEISSKDHILSITKDYD